MAGAVEISADDLPVLAQLRRGSRQLREVGTQDRTGLEAERLAEAADRWPECGRGRECARPLGIQRPVAAIHRIEARRLVADHAFRRRRRAVGDLPPEHLVVTRSHVAQRSGRLERDIGSQPRDRAAVRADRGGAVAGVRVRGQAVGSRREIRDRGAAGNRLRPRCRAERGRRLAHQRRLIGDQIAHDDLCGWSRRLPGSARRQVGLTDDGERDLAAVRAERDVAGARGTAAGAPTRVAAGVREPGRAAVERRRERERSRVLDRLASLRGGDHERLVHVADVDARALGARARERVGVGRREADVLAVGADRRSADRRRQVECRVADVARGDLVDLARRHVLAEDALDPALRARERDVLTVGRDRRLRGDVGLDGRRPGDLDGRREVSARDGSGHEAHEESRERRDAEPPAHRAYTHRRCTALLPALSAQ